MNIVYQFNGKNFKDYGVYVSASKGLVGLPNRKKPNIFEFPGESGYIPDLQVTKYEARLIDLTCFIKANDTDDLIDNYLAFTMALYSISGIKTLQVSVESKMLSFQVYLDNISDLAKTFSNGVNVGTFTLKFIEPDTSIYETSNN